MLCMQIGTASVVVDIEINYNPCPSKIEQVVTGYTLSHSKVCTPISYSVEVTDYP